MKVLYVTSEAAPFAKTGGLADVAGSLPDALNARGVSTRVILPLYECIGEEWRREMTFLENFDVTLGWRRQYCGVFQLKRGKTVFYFVDNEYYFKRERLYGHFDDGERFAFFSRAVAELVSRLDWRPDVLSCNDWQTALVPVYMKELYGSSPEFSSIKTVFTIHNIEYQGRYSKDILGDVFGLPSHWFTDGTLEYRDDVSLMKGALLTADYVTTVSPTYAEELKYPYFAYGMDGVIRSISDHFCGILNGIDTVGYDPETDSMIAANYTAADPAGKAKCKADLQRMLGLSEEPNTPIVACVGRLVAHKGMDLVLARMDAMMGLGVQFIILGTGEHGYEQFFRAAQQRYPGRISACITFSEQLAHKIYAGADLFLMPSQKEPCGLSQMIAMRYGTVPVVRETGGLKDSVPPNGVPGGRGFTFANYNADEMTDAIYRATRLYWDSREDWDNLVKYDMEGDYGWPASALEYRRLYGLVTGKR